MAMALFTFLLCIGASIRIAQSSPCHAQCTYDRVTGKADCSSRNLDCIPVNYPDSLVMDLSHNNISLLEPTDFSGTFTRRRCRKEDQTNLTATGPPHPEPTVSFHHRKAYHSDGGYVNNVNDDQCVESAANRSGREDDYEVTVRTNDPPQVYQELALQNKDDEYESVSVRGGQ